MTPPTRPRPHQSSLLTRFLLFPILILLHVLFTVSSLLLRLLQSLSFSSSKASHAQSSHVSGLPILSNPPPKHLAIALAFPQVRQVWAGRVNDNENGVGGVPDVLLDQRVIKSVRRAVTWAAEWGVSELSIWDNGTGHVLRLQRQITDGLLDLPPSPPSSSPPTPPQQQESHLDHPPLFTNKTLTLAPPTPHGRKQIKAHLLAPGAKDVIVASARSLYARHVQPSDIDQSVFDNEVRNTLSLDSDPELVIVHTIAPPSGWRALLPRPAPELYGYPFWLLRIAEIYAHPAPFPLSLDFLSSHLRASRLPILRKVGLIIPQDADIDIDAPTGSKHGELGRLDVSPRQRESISSSVESSNSGSSSNSGHRVAGLTRRQNGQRGRGKEGEVKEKENGEKGVLSLQAWWGAQVAWEKVEQRLGR